MGCLSVPEILLTYRFYKLFQCYAEPRNYLTLVRVCGRDFAGYQCIMAI